VYQGPASAVAANISIPIRVEFLAKAQPRRNARSEAAGTPTSCCNALIDVVYETLG